VSSPDQQVEEFEAFVQIEHSRFFPSGRSAVRSQAIKVFDLAGQAGRDDLMDRIAVSVRGLGGLPEWILDQQGKALLRTEEKFRVNALSLGDRAVLRRLWYRAGRNPPLLSDSEKEKLRIALLAEPKQEVNTETLVCVRMQPLPESQ
jgi:hypothetical protein